MTLNEMFITLLPSYTHCNRMNLRLYNKRLHLYEWAATNIKYFTLFFTELCETVTEQSKPFERDSVEVI
jgi:hypothetical protein